VSNTNALMLALKKALKAQGMTYRDVAAALELSEASVKRLFSEKTLTLHRLEAICRMMDLTITDLVMLAELDDPRISELTEEQEQELVSDARLLLVALLAVNHWTFEEITANYRFTEPELIHYLARLDRLRLIQLLPKNRIKLSVAPNFAWRKEGPIERFFSANVQGEFFRSRFDRPGELLLFLYGMLSESSNAVIQRRLEQVAREFNVLNQEDVGLPLGQRFGCSLLLAIRPWELSVFAALRRPENGRGNATAGPRSSHAP
jgi:DNA-binding Xre family transcriptional regulator